MRFKTDENIHPNVAAWLRARGAEADTVWDEKLDRMPDDLIAAAIQAESRTFITFDTGFCDVRRYPPSKYAGIIVMRLPAQDEHSQVEAIQRLWRELARIDPHGALLIVDSNQIRIRRSA